MPSERHCLRALSLHEEKLAALPNVQGLGVVAGKGESVDSDDCAVGVYVDRKRPLEELAPDERIPETLEVPEGEGGRVRKVPVRVIEQGPVGLE